MELQSSILEIAEQVKKRVVSPVELTRDCLQRIERLNSTLNAFITITAESAMSQARQAEQDIQHGRWRGPLHGIPLALKDILDTAGVRTTAASALFKERIPAEDAEVVRRAGLRPQLLPGSAMAPLARIRRVLFASPRRYAGWCA